MIVQKQCGNKKLNLEESPQNRLQDVSADEKDA